MRQIHLSNGSTIKADLVVYRDWIESDGDWRLFWADIDNPYRGFNDASTVTGSPHFATREAAVTHGEQRYGVKAATAAFHRN